MRQRRVWINIYQAAGRCSSFCVYVLSSHLKWRRGKTRNGRLRSQLKSSLYSSILSHDRCGTHVSHKLYTRQLQLASFRPKSKDPPASCSQARKAPPSLSIFMTIATAQILYVVAPGGTGKVRGVININHRGCLSF